MKLNRQQEPLLSVRNLCQYFGTTKAVDDVSFDVMQGEVFGLVGESGCGKTTTGRSIIKLYNITSGDIYYKGARIAFGSMARKKEISSLRKRFFGADADEKVRIKKRIAQLKREIRQGKHDHENCDKLFAERKLAEVEEKYQPLLESAYGAELEKIKRDYQHDKDLAKKTRLTTQIQMIFQDPIASLDPRMTVYEIISEGLVIAGEKNKAIIDEKVYKILETVGLVREHASRYPHEFSGGQRQRIGVARAVIMEPELIIADEPVSALDVSIQAQVINLLNRLRKQLGLTVLFIAHDLSVVKYFSDRIGVMYYGHLVELATSDELFRHPLHPYTQSLLSAIPFPDPLYERQRKRIKYDPLEKHDYSVDKPRLREVLPGHFVRCNQQEFECYQKELNAK
ncbi:MAG TPA: ATP-binding cassette domain-containing protein [Clostridiales bacterium]|jgi:oligopeptide transport system ATP-binding protein|nr:ATP-binding cassette domain-containing protein [Clostridiales bacterium]